MPLIEALESLPPIPSDGQWANFVRNHDELDLGRLSDAERQAVFAVFGPEPEMQLYERGTRRRLPLMLGGDLWLLERQSVRTPMQWRNACNAGFSRAAADQRVLPIISDGE